MIFSQQLNPCIQHEEYILSNNSLRKKQSDENEIKREKKKINNDTTCKNTVPNREQAVLESFVSFVEKNSNCDDFIDFDQINDVKDRETRDFRESRRKHRIFLERQSAVAMISSSNTKLSTKRMKVEKKVKIEPHIASKISPYMKEQNQTWYIDNNVVKEDSDDLLDMFASESGVSVENEIDPKNEQCLTSTTRSSLTTVRMIDAGNYDDSEGYYRVNIGEIMSFPIDIKNKIKKLQDKEKSSSDIKFVQFRILGIIGKGVFSTVVKCNLVTSKNSNVFENEHTEAVNSTEQNPSTNKNERNTMSKEGTLNENSKNNIVIAAKIIRNNETMAKAAQKELQILRLLSRSSTKSAQEDSNNETTLDKNKHIVCFLELTDLVPSLKDVDMDSTNHRIYSTSPPLLYRNHILLLFEYQPYNLREIISKFGKNIGIKLCAVRSYAKQLLSALIHLQSHHIVHADIKPDNILVKADFSTVQICDFGSAFFENDIDTDPTPYLVSRFYRAPEIILGFEYDRNVDLWSYAVTLGELFTGAVMFPGRSNNHMLYLMMELFGPFSHKLIKRHIMRYNTKFELAAHFELRNKRVGSGYQFRKQEVDPVTSHPVVRIINVTDAIHTKSLDQYFLRSKSADDAAIIVKRFSSYLSHCLALDATKRCTLTEALNHDFFKKNTTSGDKIGVKI